MLPNASYMFFFKKKTKQNQPTMKKREKSITWQESNPRPLRCIHCAMQPLLRAYVKLIAFNIFVPGEVNHSR